MEGHQETTARLEHSNKMETKVSEISEAGATNLKGPLGRFCLDCRHGKYEMAEYS